MAAAPDEVLFVNFNQDYSSLEVGTRKGYRLYSLGSVEELGKIHESEVGDVCCVERLFSSSLVTLVSQSAPRKLRVAHFQKGTEICSHSYSNTILSVHLNRHRVVVILENSIYIHNIRDMKVLHTIRDTPSNPAGLGSLTPADSSLLAYPASATAGEVHVFDAHNLSGLSIVPAHEGPLAALKLSEDGSKLATASDKGTVIRVFAMPGGERLFEFRRGVKRCATIYSLAFSKDNLFLASTSNTETIHVFKLDSSAHPANGGSEEKRSSVASTDGAGKGWMDFAVSTATSYLPAQMTEVFAQERSFATARLPCPGTKSVCAILNMKGIPRLLVASQDGYLYLYNLERGEGGECSLLKQHRFAGFDQTGPGATLSDGSAPLSPSYAATADPQPPQQETLKREVADVTDRAEGLQLSDSQEFPPMSHNVH